MIRTTTAAAQKGVLSRPTDMQGAIESKWNYAVTFLELSFGDRLLSTGSGFFWRSMDKWYLITNWHVVTGKDPFTGNLILASGAIPDRVRFSVYRRIAETENSAYCELRIATLDVPYTLIFHIIDVGSSYRAQTAPSMSSRFLWTRRCFPRVLCSLPQTS